MDGVHDLGGKEGFGAVASEPYPSGFHAFWEKKINAMNSAMVQRGVYNMDQYRYAIERMDPRHYLTASYYERVFIAVVTLCVESGVITKAELHQALGPNVRLSRPIGPGRHGHSKGPFLIGDRVRINDEHVSGHTRMPGYVRGKVGQVVGISPPYPFPDAAAHGDHEHWEPTYDVAFPASELWGDPANCETIHVGVFESYLSVT